MEKGTRKLLEQIKEQNYKNYPIENTLLMDATDYIKNNYFKHLALVLTQKGDVSKEQRCLFSRMLEGVKSENGIEEYIRQAYEVEIGHYLEFMEQMREMEVKYRFLLDALLLVCCSSPDKEQMELVAAFMESLKIPYEEAEGICKIGKSILEQDEGIYWQYIISSAVSMNSQVYEDYTHKFMGDYISVGNKTIELMFVEKKEVDKRFLAENKVPFSETNAGGISFSEKERVVIQNAVLSVGYTGFLFVDCKEILFDNCYFVGRGRPESVKFHNTHTVTFHNCEFMDFTRYAVVVENQKNDGIVSFLDCSFENCYSFGCDYHQDWQEIGAVIHSSGGYCGFLLERCKFDKCGYVNRGNTHSSAIILNRKATVRNCTFRQCWGYYDTCTVNDNKIDPEDPQRTLFVPGTIDENNTITDSANFS